MIVLYGNTLPPLVEELRDADTTLLSPLYINDAAFDGLMRRSMAQIRLSMDQGPDWAYLPGSAKSLFIAGKTKDKKTDRWELEQA